MHAPVATYELKYKAEIHRDFADVPEVHCLPGQLGQVFMNGIVKKHGGSIEVSSEPGKGARFGIGLPVSGPDEMPD